MQLRVQDKLLKLFECFMERENRDLDIKNTPKRFFEESGIETWKMYSFISLHARMGIFCAIWRPYSFGKQPTETPLS